ncbi:MAG TPA: MFS transporter [Croceibacterium sp.]|nr:MFS transporter [Croceibacterium sp.]
MPGLRQALAIASVLSAMALVVLDANIVNVALPSIARSLRVTAAQSVWVVTTYQAALLMGLLPIADLAQGTGLRRTFRGGIVAFVLASLGCAMAPTLGWLVAARFVQGLGGAAVMALGIAMIRATVTPARLGDAIGWNALTVALCSAAGPTVGAAILSAASWHFLFLANLPLGALALIASMALPVAPGTGRSVDLISVACLAGGVGGLILGVELSAAQPPAAAVLAACGASFLTLLWRRELPKPAPLVPLDLLRIPSFRLSVLASMSCFAGQAAALIALPFYLQQAMRLDTMTTGLILALWALTVAVAGPLSGRLSARIETGLLSAAGCATLALGLAAFALWPIGAQPHLLAIPATVCGAGFGLFQVPNNRSLFLSAPEARSAAAGGMQGTARLTGQSCGALAITLLLGSATIETAARTGLALGAIVVGGAALASLARIPGTARQAASSSASSP